MMNLRRVVSLVLLSAAQSAFAQSSPSAADEAAARVACGACAGFMFVIPLILLATAVIIAVWIYKDATKRGDPQAGMWAIIGFFFGVIGLAIYAVVRNRNTNLPPSPPPPPPPLPPDLPL
jgi:heme/copper-type cytochrome/quinol oxidase subunit 2